jgi:hypothetical protein
VNWAVRWGGACLGVMAGIGFAATFTWNGARRIATAHVPALRTSFSIVALRGECSITIMRLKPSYTAKDQAWIFGLVEEMQKVPSPAPPHVLLMENGYPVGAARLPGGGRRKSAKIDTWWGRVPLWPLVATPVLLSGWAWWRRLALRRVSGCPSCNYDLTGLPPGSPCPECAAPPQP